MEGGHLAVVRTSAVCRAPASCAARLTYSPPTHYSTGVPRHITDPFEDNTVRVNAVSTKAGNKHLYLQSLKPF